ncbi:MAG TPA: hypothetical protein VE420_16010 [Gemmatimonadales bacterium]|nr:hypothetical protein [Gemmatimonadales bacterium]
MPVGPGDQEGTSWPRGYWDKSKGDRSLRPIRRLGSIGQIAVAPVVNMRVILAPIER